MARSQGTIDFPGAAALPLVPPARSTTVVTQASVPLWMELVVALLTLTLTLTLTPLWRRRPLAAG